MGSSPWKATTAYQSDVAAALRAAQEETFASGKFGFTHKLTSMYAAMGMPAPELPEEPTAKSIEEAREIGAESGTCSVLDVTRIASFTAPGATAPFSPAEVRSAFGTDKPSAGDLEPSCWALCEHLGRGESGYFLCYDGATPSHYVFLGMSFD